MIPLVLAMGLVLICNASRATAQHVVSTAARAYGVTMSGTTAQHIIVNGNLAWRRVR
jgi:hypothetical protein